MRGRQLYRYSDLMMLALAVLPLLVCANDFLSPGLSADELLARLDTTAAPLLVDVRKPVEFGIGHIPGAKNIPLDEIKDRLDEFRNDNGVLIYCINGARTRQAEPLLFSNGIDNVYHLEGAFHGWIKEQLPIEKGGVKNSW